jgi:S-adenosylmethionine-diacylglycerol 3-amino-3-carboxypropyl transferase
LIPREREARPSARASAWLGHRFFRIVHGGHLVYNQCWEDPAVDRQALGLTRGDRVLVITSAGCNALDYALLGARVVAVDVNPRQNHLLELKRAGIRALDFDSFFTLFGEGGSLRASPLP